MHRPLSPSEIYPAGVADVDTRFLQLSTGLGVRVAERGPQQGEPVIMLHGWGASLYMWRHAFQLLPPYGIRAIGVDLRGYGLSDKPRHRGAYALDKYIADLEALYESLGLQRATLVGHSMGGALAVRFALRHPERVRRLVLINPAGLVPLVYPLLLRAMPRVFTRLVRESFVPRYLIAVILRRLAYGNPSLVTERDIDEYWAPTQLPGFVHAASAALHEFNWHTLSAEQAASLAPATMVILGRNDRLIRKAGPRAKRLHGAQVLQFDGGHSVHEERPADVYGSVGPFVR
ncbi:MAG: alpha/beta hydrolase [Gemmatimonadaceae bacterium]